MEFFRHHQRLLFFRREFANLVESEGRRGWLGSRKRKGDKREGERKRKKCNGITILGAEYILGIEKGEESILRGMDGQERGREWGGGMRAVGLFGHPIYLPYLDGAGDHVKCLAAQTGCRHSPLDSGALKKMATKNRGRERGMGEGGEGIRMISKIGRKKDDTHTVVEDMEKMQKIKKRKEERNHIGKEREDPPPAKRRPVSSVKHVIVTPQLAVQPLLFQGPNTTNTHVLLPGR